MYDHNKGKRLKPPAVIVCRQCGKAFEVQPHRAAKARYCSWQCKQTGTARGSAIKRGFAQRDRGLCLTYRKLLGKHEHRVVAEAMIGRPLARGESVHHRNGDKRDNRPDNLEVIRQGDHLRLHFRQMMDRRKETAGY
jgi:hypothetical protein